MFYLFSNCVQEDIILTYYGFINSCWIQIFVDFVVTGEPRNLMFHE